MNGPVYKFNILYDFEKRVIPKMDPNRMLDCSDMEVEAEINERKRRVEKLQQCFYLIGYKLPLGHNPNVLFQLVDGRYLTGIFIFDTDDDWAFVQHSKGYCNEPYIAHYYRKNDVTRWCYLD